VSGAVAAWWRWWRESPARDVALAVLLTAVMLVGSYDEAHPSQPGDQVLNGHPVPYTPAAAFLLVAVAGLVLAGRRRYPLTVLAVSTAAVAVYGLLGYVNGAALLLPTAALYAVAQTGSIRRAVGAAVITLAVLMAATAANNPFGTFGGGFELIPGLIAAALLGGLAVNNRRAYIASLQARAEDDARRRVDEERLRIARELHDVVAHTMATINVQASVATHVLADRPEAAAQALRNIKLASKDGLRELRAVLNVLRQADDGDDADASGRTQPTPGLGQLDALIAGTAQAGLATSLSLTGEAGPLPAAVDLAAYRIIQESLTNAIRHAGPATAAVALTYGDAELRIEVTDTGRGSRAAGGHGSRSEGGGNESSGEREREDSRNGGSGGSGSGGTGAGGHGLIGMRERAASVGGTIEAGPGRERGYRVLARLPLDGQTPADPAPQASRAPAEEGTRT
jgi:signal transduction histidine kinase